nr:immunoglobulin heavy chain junction region [Mus musculus]NSM05375.1 immunoglobulin heavy chain junction region [Mus musculus]
CGPFAYW